MDLFWRQGYEATGVAQIQAEAGVLAGSFYFFFKSKETLLLAVLDRYMEILHSALRDPVVRKRATRSNGFLRFWISIDGRSRNPASSWAVRSATWPWNLETDRRQLAKNSMPCFMNGARWSSHFLPTRKIVSPSGQTSKRSPLSSSRPWKAALC